MDNPDVSCTRIFTTLSELRLFWMEKKRFASAVVILWQKWVLCPTHPIWASLSDGPPMGASAVGLHPAFQSPLRSTPSFVGARCVTDENPKMASFSAWPSGVPGGFPPDSVFGPNGQKTINRTLPYDIYIYTYIHMFMDYICIYVYKYTLYNVRT